MCTRRRSSVGRRASSLPIVLSKNLARLHTRALRGPFLLPKIDLANLWNSSFVNGSLIAARLQEDDGSCTILITLNYNSMDTFPSNKIVDTKGPAGWRGSSQIKYSVLATALRV